jgi:hypothetical protein
MRFLLAYVHRCPIKTFQGFVLVNFLPKTLRKKNARRAGGSETTSWSQPGSREAALRGEAGFPKVPGFPAIFTNPVSSDYNGCVYDCFS